MAAIPKGVLESAFNLEDRAHDDALVADLTERVAEQQRASAPPPPTPQWSLPSLDSLLGGGTQSAQQPQQQAVPTQPVQPQQQEQPRTQGWQLPSLDVLLGRDPNARQEQPAPQGRQQAPAPASGTPSAMPTGAPSASALPKGAIDNSSRETFVRTAYPYALEAADGDATLANQLLATAISENGNVGSGKDLGADMGFNFGGIQGVEGTAGSFGALDAGRPRQFAAYRDPSEGFRAVRDLVSGGRYADAADYYRRTGDIDGYWRMVNQAGYSETPDWQDRIADIRRNQVETVTRGLAPAERTVGPQPTTPMQAEQTPGAQAQAFAAGDLTPNQYTAAKAEGLDDETAWAVCGPAAAIAFARKNGRNPTMQEAVSLAREVGWTPERGMAGTASQQKLLERMGIPSKLEQGVDWARVAADVQRGNPVIIDAGDHYMVAERYDPETGAFDFGQSAAVLRMAGGRRWFRPEELSSLSSASLRISPSATLYLDNPQSPTPSVAAGDMQRVSLNAGGAPPPATPAPAGVSSAPAGAPPAPWEQATGEAAPLMMKAETPTDGPRPRPGRNIEPLGPALAGRDVDLRYDDVTGIGTNRNMPVWGGFIQEGPEAEDPLRNVPVRAFPPDELQTDENGAYTVQYRQPLSEQAAFLPGDGGFAPTPDEQPYDPDQGPREATPGSVGAQPLPYDSRIADEGPREWQPPAPVYADPTASDPAYSAPREPDPVQGPEQPERPYLEQATDWVRRTAAPLVGAAANVYGSEIAEGNRVQDEIDAALDAKSNEFANMVRAPIDDVRRGVNIANRILMATPQAGAEVVNAALERFGLGRDVLGIDLPVVGRVGIADFVDLGPVSNIGVGRAGMVQRPVQSIIPNVGGAIESAAGAGIQAAREGIRTGAEALGRGLQGVGREVAGGLMDLNPAMAPRVTGEGPGIGRSMFGDGGGRPSKPTVEALQQELDGMRALIQRARTAGDTDLERRAIDRAWELESALVDARNARRDLEPRLESDVGRRIERTLMDERTADDLAGIGRERVSPDAAADLTEPSAVATDMSGRMNAGPPSASRGAGLGTRIAADAGASLQGGVVGAAAGYGLPADSEEERRANALRGAGIGMVGMPIAGRVVGRGMRGQGRGVRAGIIPPHVADQMGDTFPVRIPQDPKVIRAIEAIGGTVDPERGVTINVTRAQGPEAAGRTATRGGVFYEAVPEGGRSNFVRGNDDPTGVGGSQVIPARPTRFRSPLIVSDAPGDTLGFTEAMRVIAEGNSEAQAAIQRATETRAALNDALRSNGYRERAWMTPLRAAADEADAEVSRLRPSVAGINRDIREARAAGPEGSEARAAALKEVVRKYGGDTDLIEPLLRVRGADASESEWAIRENILAAHARRNGYDGVVTVEDAPIDLDALAKHPKVVAAESAFEDASRAYGDAMEDWYRRNPTMERGRFASIDESRKDPRVAAAEQRMEQASIAARDAEAAARQELSGGKITELVDVREGANPTPGAPPREVAKTERALKAAQKAEARAEVALLEAKREWTLANPRAKPDAWNQSEPAAPLIDAYWESRRAVREAERAVEDAKALPPVGDPGFSVRSDIPRPAGANWAGMPFDPASAAMGGAAGAMSEGEDGEPDPLRTAAGMFVAGLGNSRYGRRFLANAARHAQQGPPPNLWEIMQGFRFSWGMLGNLAQTGLVNVAGGPVELAKGLPTEAIRMSILNGRPVGTAHYAAEVASGLKDGARNLLATVLGEIPPSVRNAPDFRPPLSERMAGRMGQVGNVDTGAVVGEAIDLPGRLASQAPDSLWRPFFLRAGAAKERNTIMAENGVSKLDPAAQWRELQRLTNNPTPAEAQRIAEASRKHADEMGLKGDDGYAERWLKGIFRPGGRITTSADPAIAQVHEAAGSFLMPFLGAIYKLHKLAATGVPGVGFLANSKLPMDEKLSRQIVGAGMAYLMADYAAQGMITGPGPSDPDEAAIVNKKMPPNSTYLPGVGWVQNDTFSSAGPYLNAIGAYYDARRYATEKDKNVAGKGDESTVKYVLRGFERFPVVQAVQSIIAMGESPIKGVSDFAANAASSFVPAPYRTFQASQDQYARTVDREAGMEGGIVPALAEQTRQKIVSRAGYVPGLGAREDLAPALDRFGRPIENDRQGVAAFLPRVRNPQDDALTDIFTRAGIEPGMPPAEVDNIPLTTEQKREWQRVRGESLAQKQDILSRAADYPEVRRKTVFDAQMSLASDRAAQAVRRMFTPEQRAAARKKAS